MGSYWQLFTLFITIIFTIFRVSYSKKKNISVGKCILTILLFFYLVTVCASVVLAREAYPHAFIRLRPFDSWKMALKGSNYYKLQVIENILMLMPIGCILPLIDEKNKAVRTIAFGFCFSLFIEVSQYVTKTGFFEVDDLINNTCGVIVMHFCSFVCVSIVKIVKKW